jgi:hypothetical protein
LQLLLLLLPLLLLPCCLPLLLRLWNQEKHLQQCLWWGIQTKKLSRSF